MWTATSSTTAPSGPWIRSRQWDLTFILGSVVLVALPLSTYYAIAALTGTPPQSFQEKPALSIAMLINLACAFLIGGPHMYATYTLTLAERRFRNLHPWLLAAAAAIPMVVVTLAIARIELLMTIFFAWASLHAAHQLAYLVQQYHLRAVTAAPLGAWSRGIDYILVASCLYPVVLWRLLAPPGAVLDLPFGLAVMPGFHVGRVDLAQQLPVSIAGQVWIAWAFAAVFAVTLLAFLVRTLWELATGRTLWPRTLLVGITVPVVFSLPLFDNMDVSLQGFNLWHSVQYLGLVYLINGYRKQRGEISSGLVTRLSGFGNGARYYGFLVGVSLSAGALMGLLHYVAGLPMLQVYYAVLLSGLWVHYLWDHAVFAQAHALAPMPLART
jgi:hypothetical protein